MELDLNAMDISFQKQQRKGSKNTLIDCFNHVDAMEFHPYVCASIGDATRDIMKDRF